MRSWLLLLAGIGIIMSSCNTPLPADWTEVIPEKTPFLIIPEEDQTLTGMLQAPYMPLFDDVSASAIQLTGELAGYSETNLPLLAILLYPDTSNEWQPVWVTESIEGTIERVVNQLRRPFAQNLYYFKGHTIHMISIEGRILYMVDTGSSTLVSESSLAIEDMLRTHHGDLPAMTLDENQLQPGSFIANMPNMERWVEQLAQISYRPYLIDTFTGSGPLSVSLTESGGDGKLLWRLQGQMSVDEEVSPFIRGISAPSETIYLDRYISVNASAFSIFHLEPRSVPAPELDTEGELDEYLNDHEEIYREFSSKLGSEVAFVAFAESGFMSSSEFLFLRQLEDPAGLLQILNDLSEEDLIQPDGNLYYLHSTWLGKLLGSDLSPFSNFYLSIHGNTAALSRSNTLVEGVRTEHDRRRVYYYDDDYIDIRDNLPESVSSFTYLNGPEFNNYLQPWLYPQNYFGALSSSLETLTITTSRSRSNANLDVDISSYAREATDAPYRERWVYPISSDITDVPVLANISGNTTQREIVFSTDNGNVYVIGTDGSTRTEASTLTDPPVGPPVVYDWYGNNQNIIMQAAGNKIYAWNESGAELPSFPVVMDEQITAPLHVEDVTRNGVAEMIVATADRNVHILNSRGEDISGWPQTANSIVQSKPVIAQVEDQRSVFAFAENGLHSWNINGTRRDGFPVFIESRFNGSPFIHENHILGAAADGNLYATGPADLFADTLAASSSGDSLITQSLNVSNTSLNRPPAIYNEMTRVDGELIREDLILTQSSNGSIQIFNLNGNLRFTQNMGQPGSDDVSPLVMDINGNNRQDVISLASSGRLYAWDLLSGNRIYDLPTSGMRYPVFEDLNNDGNTEIITQTREGLRTWTIFRQGPEGITRTPE